ncbi:FAD/NADP-binding domain-containing protein [Dacryopinax primogenitus]|uniref:FAD/NADP-binding domain-containing protein n=1 Tax=Dacryopinax primogenitus (strain DJM 731) TaxID=1858805 RepID=M5FXD2_DACPD|nr:FAD/NADP-binding domain-containing protein [Dacryopinax primogenitus]EJU00435.1 FAD/NADP-binding domain-containing protein [Dacryopinax primogenitus]
MEPAEALPFPQPPIPANLNPEAIAQHWLNGLNTAIRGVSVAGPSITITTVSEAVSQLFSDQPKAFWKDHLALSLDLRTMHGHTQIITLLLRCCSPEAGMHIGSFAMPGEGEGPRAAWVQPASGYVELWFGFQTRVGECKGVAKLIPTLPPGQAELKWKAWTVYTELVSLRDLPFDRTRLEKRSATEGLAGPRDVDVVVLGAGQSGLQVAAHLLALGLSVLVVEREAQVGNQWDGHYAALKVHVTKWFYQFPYLNFPPEMPTYPSGEEMASYLRLYASKLHLPVRTATQVLSASFHFIHSASTDGKWELSMKPSDGPAENWTCRYLVSATGLSGKVPNMPEIPARDEYKGIVLHSSQFRTGEGWAGKKAIVVGTGCSGHDIASELYRCGAKVTLHQRSPTMVLPPTFVHITQDSIFTPDADLDAADREWNATPLQVVARLGPLLPTGDKAKEIENGLVKRGFQMKEIDFTKAVYERIGGLYIDVGASELIVDGKIAIKSGMPIVSYTPTGLAFADGTTLDANLIVFATGFNISVMRSTIVSIVGSDIGSTLKSPWGLDREGHLLGVGKFSGHPNIYYMAGEAQMSRTSAKLVALQLTLAKQGLLNRVDIPYDIATPA